MNDELQRTEAWHKARLGKFTSSRLKELMTSGRGKETVGLTAIGYIMEVATETLTGQAKTFSSVYTEWGMEHEEEAIKEYMKRSKKEVLEAGFIPHKKLNFGGSPDGLIRVERAIIEVKCPANSTKMFNILRKREVPSEYIYQIQANMWVTDASYCDFIMYDPRMKKPEHQMVIIQVKRDEQIIKEIEQRLIYAEAKMAELLGDINFDLEDI